MNLSRWGKHGLSRFDDAFIDGTAAVPSMTFLTDPDTGIYRVGANILGFATQGVQAFYIAADSKLTFNAAVTNGGIFQSNYTGMITMTASPTSDQGGGQLFLHGGEDSGSPGGICLNIGDRRSGKTPTSRYDFAYHSNSTEYMLAKWFYTNQWVFSRSGTFSGTFAASTQANGPGIWVDDDSGYLMLSGGAVSRAQLTLHGHSSGSGAGGAFLSTSNAAGTNVVTRLQVTGAANNAVMNLTGLGVAQTFIVATTANNDSINAAPTAIVLTAANAKSFTGIAHNIILPAITPAANGGGITLTGLNLGQGAIANVADSEAITVKQITITGAAGVALETGAYVWTGIDITTPAQAANSATNLAKGIKITGGATAGGASATQIGIDITMAAATDTAINVVTGKVSFSAGAGNNYWGEPATLGNSATNRIFVNASAQFGCVLNNAGQFTWTDGQLTLNKAQIIAGEGSMTFKTRNVAAAQTTRLTISDSADTAVATWAAITHTGFTLSAAQKVQPVSGVAGFGVVSTALTLGSAGSVVVPVADFVSAANDAARDVLAGNVDGAYGIDSAGNFLYCRVGGAWKKAALV